MARQGAGTLFLLWLSLLQPVYPSGTLHCASVAVDPPVVALGSAVTASCTIRRELCHGLEQGKVRITWMLDNEPVTGNQHRDPEGMDVSTLTLPQFNRTQAKLWCWLEWNGAKQRVGMAEIRAGYPPSKPFNLSCILNLSDYGLTCHQCRFCAPEHHPGQGQAVTPIPCHKLFSLRFQGGFSPSSPLESWLHLMASTAAPWEAMAPCSACCGIAPALSLALPPAKPDPPALQSIQSIPSQTDCVTLAWEVARSTAHMELECELRYRAPEDPTWALVHGIAGQPSTLQSCGFLFGTRYHFQMRCRRSSAQSYWSVWSPGRNYTTHEKGGVNWRVPALLIQGGCARGLAPLSCPLSELTDPKFCPMPSPRLPSLLWAQHGAGGLARRGRRAQQQTPQPPLLSVAEGIEPLQRYNISVYPLYKDAVGVPIHTAAYSKQKAPSRAPKLHLKSISKSSAELCWDPVPVEMQNGFITSYTIFWASSNAEVASAAVNPTLSSFVIQELKPSTLYKVHIMASTTAGSTNSTSLTLVTMVLDDTEIQFLFLTLGLIFVLLILLLICLQKNGRVKQQFWPSVPDPANSSLGKWVPAELQQEPPPVPGVKDPGPATISTVTVLERVVGKQPSAETTVPVVPQPYVRQGSLGKTGQRSG
ncbi:Granulocyte colony-stimulating factor receptor, partial [Calypte anna]